MTNYLMENPEEEPQVKKLCNTRTVVELFAHCFKPSKRGVWGGEEHIPCFFLPVQEGVAEKNVL